MKQLKVLDVTLRDGGCVNNFDFGQDYMDKILFAQESAGVDVVELGYIDEQAGSACGRTQFIDDQAITQSFLKNKKDNISYVVMMDYGKFNADNLQKRSHKSIDGIRLAFHKKNIDDIVEAGKVILDKGYELYIQPMITLRYTDAELLTLIDLVNNELSQASAFYIVDSFGEMRPNDMERTLNLVDHNLNPNIQLGFHSHNNLQMSYSNAIEMLQFPTNRDIIIDSSIMGMGKGAGNLNTELLLDHLNLYYGKHYQISPLLEVMDKVINQLHAEHYWGYAPEYYLSSANHCTPSYAIHFYNKHKLPIDQVDELLALIAEEKKISFDKEYAEGLYRTYNEGKSIDDTATVNDMTKIFCGNTVLVIAPGRSMIALKDKVREIAASEASVVIGLNNDFGLADYILTTQVDIYERAVDLGQKVIVCSNISKGGRENVQVLDYKKWIETGEETHDSSAVIALKLLKCCGAKRVLLAGFDGFSLEIKSNYYDESMRRPLTSEQVKEKNLYYSKFIKKMKDNGLDIKFVTPSKYESSMSNMLE